MNMSICPFTYLNNHKSRLLHVHSCHGSVLLWRLCYTLCTFGFVDDVMWIIIIREITSCMLLHGQGSSRPRPGFLGAREFRPGGVLQCFDTVGWASGRAPGLSKLSDEVLVWLSVWSEVQIVCMWSSWCQCIPKPHHLLLHLNPDWFYLSGAGLLRLSWKRGR